MVGSVVGSSVGDGAVVGALVGVGVGDGSFGAHAAATIIRKNKHAKIFFME